jgi:signal transduction histidine kinase
MASRQIRQETQFVASLFEVPREIEKASLSEFLMAIVSRCAEWFGASTVSFFLAENGSQTMTLAATGGDPSSIPASATIQIGQGIAGIAAQDGEPVLIHDQDFDSKFRSLLGKGKRRLVSSMVVPLSSRGECIGVLNLSRSDGKTQFSRSDLRLAKGVASHLSLAIENARLVASLQVALRQNESERAKFRGIFEGLGLAAFLLDEQGLILESNSAAKALNLDELPQGIFGGEEIEYRDRASGRSWRALRNPIPGGRTLVLEETTELERQRAEMDRLNRLAEIGQMTAAIAHEIRNPLTGILSAAQMIREAPEASDEFARIIEHEAMKLNELCGDFLGFARPVYTSSQPLNVEETVRRVARLMTPQFLAKEVRLDVEIAPNLPMIHGDPLHWEQVLQNLMLNALQASRAGGRVSVGASPSGVWVEDEGCGMSEEQLERLFSPFFTTKPQGTGLGLSNVKKIVDAHGGMVTVESRLGEGSRFLISFPLEKAA